MPRANRYFLPGYVWHNTINAAASSNRSSRSIAALGSKRSNPDFHQRFKIQNFLKFARDRRRYLQWLFEAKKRFGLSVLDYMVTSNHIYLVVKDTGANIIAESMQLIAGRTAQEFNQHKGKQGAFWEDRYHATAIESEEYLHRCPGLH